MPVKACATYVGVNDKRIWRVIRHQVSQSLLAMDLRALKAIGLDETASQRGHNYVTVFRLLAVFLLSGGTSAVAAWRVQQTHIHSHHGDRLRVFLQNECADAFSECPILRMRPHSLPGDRQKALPRNVYASVFWDRPVVRTDVRSLQGDKQKAFLLNDSTVSCQMS